MSTGDARHGRRDNGLVANEYAAAGDVDPRVGEHLLDVLALDGIAAYLRPSTDLHPVTRSTLLPSRPTDRLYVDRAHVATARDYLSRLAGDAERAEQAEADRGPDPTAAPSPSPSPSPSPAPAPSAGSKADAGPREGHTDDLDAAWAQIVAGYDETATPERPEHVDRPTPRTETATEEPVTDPRPEADTRTTYYRVNPRLSQRPMRSEEPSLLEGLDTFGADLPDDGDDTFTPPVAPPVPRPSMPTALAVFGIVGGLFVFLKPDLLSFMTESLAMFFGFTAIVTGFGTLVWRLRPGDDDEDPDPDNGAKV